MNSGGGQEGGEAWTGLTAFSAVRTAGGDSRPSALGALTHLSGRDILFYEGKDSNFLSMATLCGTTRPANQIPERLCR